MVWHSGPVPPITHGSIEFWLDEELLLTVQTDDLTVTPVEGMYVRYVSLAGVEEEYRIGDVTIILVESQTAGHPADPPNPAIPGSIVLTPLIKVELRV